MRPSEGAEDTAERASSSLGEAPARMTRFRDRQDAGRQLAAMLESYAAQKPIVLALPRGGVPVGYEVARHLRAQLDVVVVRKVGVPWHHELGVGAVAPPKSIGSFVRWLRYLSAIGRWYEDFRQVDDDDVVRLLEIARSARSRARPPRPKEL
jgi:predicted phosphoribosyltransferase